MQAFSTIQAKFGCSNINISDLTITNSRGWTLQMEGYDGTIHDNKYTNLKIINWNISSDGIWLDGDRNTIDNCFVFNNDDLFMTRGANNCMIKNCIVWGGAFGNLFMQNAFNPSNGITYDNIDIIGKDGINNIPTQLIEILSGSGDF